MFSLLVTQTRNVLSVPGFDNEYANYEDLAMFLDKYRPDLVGASFTSQSIDGGLNIQSRDSAGGEANLDIQYTVGLVNFTPVDFISSGMNSINGFIRLVHHWLDQDNPPTVVSISYGFNEHILSTQSTGILCTLFAQLGARGVSVLVSSGDGGVAGSQAPEETPHDFIPTFPAGCPFVTAVGATKGFPTEIAAPLSAGGFSNYFERPSYQAAAVKDYLDQIGSLYNDRFNPTGRAFPDISAQGDNIAIVINQKQDVTGGTSASTPIVASTIALLNDRLIQKGKKPLGFLNPWLYANQGVFNDIISGSNPGCGTNGFPAKVGWDPVTGLGTPNFAKMAKALDV
ncbi:hypothetical protein APHAL10511_000559 [Amanita phalloides]|nr:hypothetical protein APHAL10511_000559 [Amanita phalloides]